VCPPKPEGLRRATQARRRRLLLVLALTQHHEVSPPWTLTELGAWFFENPNHPLPSLWLIRWAFPDGQTCDTPFTVM